MRDFAHEPMPNSSKAPESFDPVPCRIAADWHMGNPDKNHGLLSPKALFHLINTLEDVGRFFDLYDYIALAHYNDRLYEQRYPFVVAFQNEVVSTPSQRVRLRRQAGLPKYPDDYLDRFFLAMILRVTRMKERVGKRRRVGLLLLLLLTMTLLCACGGDVGLGIDIGGGGG